MQKCPNCSGSDIKKFYEVKNVPIHDVVLINTYDEAINYPKRNVRLGFCSKCSFVFNTSFDFSDLEYDDNYEETQGFSPTFSNFHKNLAERLIKKYDLYDKSIIEIGCGKGEFLTLLCEIGNNIGYGFDPVYVSNRYESKAADRLHFIKDFYSEKYADYKGDFYCCKMTLEHIANTSEFVSMIRKCIGDNTNATVYFLLPDAEKVFKELGFWDIFYEHCSYFSLSSLSYLFRNSGFEILEVGREYDDQYLMIEAKPTSSNIPLESSEFDISTMTKTINVFEQKVTDKINEWKTLLNQYKSEEKKIVLWGGGSKGVAFLTTLGIKDEIKYAVDINPFKQGTFMAGNGQEIVSPEFLIDYNPDVVIIMNPIYVNEITADLKDMNLDPVILSLN